MPLDLSDPSAALVAACHAFGAELQVHLPNAEECHFFTFINFVNGKPEVDFSLNDFHNRSGAVKGTDPRDVLVEYLRRRDWTRAQNTRLLEAPASASAAVADEPEDDIPF